MLPGEEEGKYAPHARIRRSVGLCTEHAPKMLAFLDWPETVPFRLGSGRSEHLLIFTYSSFSHFSDKQQKPTRTFELD